MAKLEQTLYEDFDHLLNRIEDGIKAGSSSATLEESSDFAAGNARCSVRVNLNVTLFQVGDGPVELSAITSGGSQAMFFKINTLGEEAFLDKLREIL